VTRFLSAAALAAFALAASPAAAQTKPAPAAQAPQQQTRADFAKNVDAAFAVADANHDGFVTRNEIESMQTKELQSLKAAQQQRLQEEFKKLDTDKNGSISLAEFSAVARPLPPVQPDAPITQLDTNKDGKIGRDEYRAPKLASFDKADANHDGTLTVQELQAAATRK
jgi:Ca2+-binding EF-hand superfamily protein